MTITPENLIQKLRMHSAEETPAVCMAAIQEITRLRQCAADLASLAEPSESLTGAAYNRRAAELNALPALSELERLARAATVGEWHYHYSPTCQEPHSVFGPVSCDGSSTSLVHTFWKCGDEEANMRYIAAANPQTILTLIAQLREAEGLARKE